MKQKIIANEIIQEYRVILKYFKKLFLDFVKGKNL